MKTDKLKRNAVLGILFFLPVAFLLMLYPSTHNYEPLEIVNTDVREVSISKESQIQDHITVLAFFGSDPMAKMIGALNLKELVYDKFKGFKKFQIIVIGTTDTEQEYNSLKKEIAKYEELKFWHYVYHTEEDIVKIYNSLKSDVPLDSKFATNEVFIVDKDRNQRGRLDDRKENEVEANKPISKLYSYNFIEVSEIKNKMSDDMRILLTEYRQKRKGKFEDSNSRRAKDLKQIDE